MAIALLTFLAYGVLTVSLVTQQFMASPPRLLTDPFLQLPTETSVRVVWFTEFEGDRHRVEYGENLEQTAIATTIQLSRIREDQKSRVGEQTEDGQIYTSPVMREVWRHEAEITGLTPNVRVPYRVRSNEGLRTISSNEFTLAAKPLTGTPLKILLTSDHQMMPLTPANLQKVVETVGRVDAVFVAGDLINIPDRASEWFDDNRGGAFFPSLQGRANRTLDQDDLKIFSKGGEIIQHAPLFAAIGNHEVMGRFSMESDLNEQFNDPYPQAAAEQLYAQITAQNAQNTKQLSPDNQQAREWLENNTFNTDTYEEIFTLPESESGGEKYYAVSFGDVRLVALYATNIWRVPSLEPDARGRYRERQDDLNDPARWGYGQHIFEAIAPGSPQYTWLEAELNSPEFQQARYKIVMFHHPPHSLGDNVVPAYTDPVQAIDRDAEGRIQAVRYEYPKQADYLIRDVMPLLEQAGVQLVFYGHSHLWNRFVNASGMNFLESSNVGNTYGAYLEKQRAVPTGYQEEYVATGDPNNLQPVIPSIAPLLGDKGQPLPYISSNEITVFSILHTETGTVDSYRFDAKQPELGVVRFDQFSLTAG
ncbi:MAG: metallophosphoesterase family protein [Leptolyngbyaceae cyanobacterium SM1_4_3]|nr:metallophosphoesterase family protein [Leptolyngbyaceae cyanobacterium SM1_4_3]NJN89574.1 metallophosphoesterase family protein [Leptolyngbyaceae cyanobacterium SL_5_14]